jgi:hypothetical protein
VNISDNKAASGNGAIALSFHVEQSCRAVPEQQRSPKAYAP